MTELNYLHAESGERIDRYLNRALEHAKQTQRTIRVSFNDTEINVYPESYAADLIEKWYFKHHSS